MNRENYLTSFSDDHQILMVVFVLNREQVHIGQ